ncbi:MAG: protein phosphatase 2C domain-containing protein [Planctomycetales bacterium]|nr:protein phosphatase 2C domain-containing protein [Planctomycetales bacterium]
MSDGFATPLRWRAYQLPKRGNRVEEFEDALAGDAQTGRFAVADGATESVCSDVWAKLLVEGYLAQPITDVAEWIAWLAPLRRRWWDDVGQRELPWYAEHKLADGAAAALVGLVIQPDKTWQAVAVGDSCLFQMRAGELIEAFPITRSDDFNNRPRLISSHPPKQEPQLQTVSGVWQSGDELLLMTDALAQWFLSKLESQQDPVSGVRYLLDLHDNPAEQAVAIESLRDAEVLRNDDVILSLIEV